MSNALAIKKSKSSALVEVKKSFDNTLENEFFYNFESPHTRKCYRRDLTQFFSFISEYYPNVLGYRDIERAHAIFYRNKMQDSELAPKTINRKLAAASSFFDFLLDKSVVEFNPFHSIKRPKHQVQAPTNDLSDEQIQNLFAAVNDLKEEYLLHKAVIYLLFTTGIRKAELINLKIKDLKIIDGIATIEIKAKGGKFLTKVVHPSTYEVLQEYLRYLKGLAGKDGAHLNYEEPLFRPSKNPLHPEILNKPLNPKSVDYILKIWCKKAGIFHRVSPHSARASYIGSALDNGVDLYKISRDVGHASVKTTEEYNKRKQRISESPVWGLGFMKKISNEKE